LPAGFERTKSLVPGPDMRGHHQLVTKNRLFVART